MSNRSWGPAMRRWIEDGPQHGVEFHLTKRRRGGSGKVTAGRDTDDDISRITDDDVLRVVD